MLKQSTQLCRELCLMTKTELDQQLAALLEDLIQIKNSPPWTRFLGYMENLYEMAMTEMEDAKNYEEFCEARGLVRSLRTMKDFKTELVDDIDRIRRERNGA
jgi:hypothetical protein